MGNENVSKTYTTDIPPTKSILDQVDDYLNEKRSQGWVEWQSIQVDLDQLSHTLFENRQEIQEQRSAPAQGERDIAFSPMGSPVVACNHLGNCSANATPFLAGSSVVSNSATNTPFLSANGKLKRNENGHKNDNRDDNRNDNGQSSPITSPVLANGPEHQSLVNFSLPESSLSKRMPSSTPLRGTKKVSTGIGPTSSKILKNSPNLTCRRRYSADYFKNNSNSWDDLIFKLPENGSVTCRDLAGEGNVSGSPDSPSIPECKMTPAALMNYPKVILPSNNSQSSEDRLEIGNNDNTSSKVWRATESPVIKPRNSSQQKAQLRNSQFSSNTSCTSSSSFTQEPFSKQENNYGKTRTNRSSRSSSLSLNGTYACGGADDDDECSKREVHKVAEQGRRNRLNMALTELSALLPADLKDTVSIPSKATTVELACTYIKQLTKREQEDH